MLDTLGLFDGQTAADVTRVMNASILMGPAVTLQPFITLASWITR
jgi:hypothetical protein